MPIRQGNAATNLLNFAPGINNSSAYGGDASSGNGLLIDGVDTRDPSGGTAWTFYNYNIVDEVQIQGIGAPAEYGAFTGAIVNTITKSGGNRFAGLFDVIYTKSQPGQRQPERRQRHRANPTLAEPAKIKKLTDLTAQLSGPIIKDKLFFFAVRAALPAARTIRPGPRTVTDEVSARVNGKLTWQPSANDTRHGPRPVRHLQHHRARGLSQRSTDTDAITNREDAPECVWITKWRHLFGSKTFIEVKYTGLVGLLRPQPRATRSPCASTRTAPTHGRPGLLLLRDRGRHQVNASPCRTTRTSSATTT